MLLQGVPKLLRRLVVLLEANCNTIDTMSLVCRGWEAFSFEDMALMASAAAAGDLNTLHAKGSVDVAVDGARDSVVEGRPAAARLELRLGLVEGLTAASASVDTTRGVVFVVFSCPSHLRSLASKHVMLFRDPYGVSEA